MINDENVIIPEQNQLLKEKEMDQQECKDHEKPGEFLMKNLLVFDLEVYTPRKYLNSLAFNMAAFMLPALYATLRYTYCLKIGLKTLIFSKLWVSFFEKFIH